MQFNFKPLILPVLVLLVISGVMASEYCTPPGSMNVTYTHDGNWFNFTITSDDCYVCVDNGAGYGDVECTVCDAPPVVHFLANQTCGVIPFNIQFTDTSTATPISWNWSFGDGAFSELQHPNHTYTTVGVFPVNLSATNIIGTGYLNGSTYITARPVGDTCPTGVVGYSTQLLVQSSNGMAWAAPFILAGVGFCIIVFGLRRKGKQI